MFVMHIKHVMINICVIVVIVGEVVIYDISL